MYSYFRFRRSIIAWLYRVFVIVSCVSLGAGGVFLGTQMATASTFSQPALVKTDSSPVIYYVYNSQRYGFPNEKTFFTWYTNFSSVIPISSSELASYPLVKIVQYRPNDRLLKITTDPKVYAVSRCGVLHWIASEQLAIQLWGSQWNRLIDDLPDAFFSTYSVGSAYSKITDYLVDPSVHTIADNATCGTTPVVTNPPVAPAPPQSPPVTTPANITVSASLSTASASPASVPADGSSISTISVNVKNSLGQPLAGKIVRFYSSLAGSIFASSSLTSDSSGNANMTIKSSSAGAATVTVVADGSTLATKPAVTFTAIPVVPAPVSPPVVPGPVSSNTHVQKVGSCQIYPADNWWNTDISSAPIHAMSDTWIAAITPTFKFHAAFTHVFDIVDSTAKDAQGNLITPFINTHCSTAPGTAYCFNSDLESKAAPGSMPIPKNAKIQGGPNGTTDRHVVVIDTGTCKEYEMYRAFPRANGDWDGVSGGIFDLTTNTPRPFGKPATTAGNLPLYPGLVKYAEVQAGQIDHALFMSIDAMQMQQAAYLPATGYASNAPNPKDPNLIPMGAHLRIKPSYDITWLKPWPEAYTMARAMKQYGIIIGDGKGSAVSGVWQGVSGHFNGEQDPAWNFSNIIKLYGIPASALEFVDVGVPIHY